MGGGGIKDSQNQLKGISQQQQTESSALTSKGSGIVDQSLGLVQQGQAEQSPLGDFLKRIIGGDSTTTSQALAPAIGNITAGTTGNRERIFDTTAPGAGRDILLGENQRNQGTQVAQATNQTFLQAFPELANLGGTTTGQGLQLGGLGTGLTNSGITSLGNSASTTGSVLQSQEQQKANTMNLISGLAGTAGSIATGGFGGTGLIKSLSGGGGGGNSSTTLKFPFGS